TLAGSVTSSVATLTVLSRPLITQQPQSQMVKVSSNALFSVNAIGNAPLVYQWRFNQTEILGASSSSYTRTNAQCGDASGYDVVVANLYGSTTSSVANLIVVAPPVMLLQPTNQTVLVGQTAAFIATATNQCGGGLVYQWQLSGNALPGATNISLS